MRKWSELWRLRGRKQRRRAVLHPRHSAHLMSHHRRHSHHIILMRPIHHIMRAMAIHRRHQRLLRSIIEGRVRLDILLSAVLLMHGRSGNGQPIRVRLQSVLRQRGRRKSKRLRVRQSHLIHLRTQRQSLRREITNAARRNGRRNHPLRRQRQRKGRSGCIERTAIFGQHLNGLRTLRSLGRRRHLHIHIHIAEAIRQLLNARTRQIRRARRIGLTLLARRR